MGRCGEARVIAVSLPLVGTDAVGQVVRAVGRVEPGLAARLHAGSETRPYACERLPGAGRLLAWCFDAEIAAALLAGEATARVVGHHAAAEAFGDGGERLTVTFRSPTHFRAARRDYLFPGPERLFADLLGRWRALGWPEVPEPNLNRVAGQIEAWRMATHPCDGGRARTGFVGRAVYDLWGASGRDREVLWALARFGSWRGAGAHTGYGMGRIGVGPEAG